MAERLNFDILARDNASAGFIKAGRAAAAASDDVLGLARRLDEVQNKRATARVELAGNKEAQAELDKLDLKMLTVGRRVVDPKISIEGAARASAEISGLDAKLDGLIAKSGEATAATGASGGGLSGVSGMGALIAAGVVLTPVIATLATGLAGFGAAAYGAASPIMKAAQATGGLQANMHTLNPEQQGLAKSILGLGKQYDTFQQSLQPEVLDVFGKGLRLAAGLMHDVEPVAKTTGTALGGMLGAIDTEFRSGTWQSFFGFMAKTAGPDIALLRNSFVNLIDALPGLLETLQPLATEMLKVVAASTKLIDISSHIIGTVDGSAHSTNRWQQALSKTALTVFATGTGLLPATLLLRKGIDLLAGSTTTIAARTNIFAGTLKSVNTALVPVGRNTFVIGNQAQAAASHVTALNSAWSTFVGASAGVEAAQLAVIQNLRTMNKESRAAGASFTGVNAASIILQTDFESNLVPGIQNVIGSGRTAHATMHQLATVISTDLKPAVDAGALANKGMRQQIFDMAQQAGYTGPNRIKPLTGFIDRNAGSIRDADKITRTWSANLAKIPGSEHTKITVTGAGSWTVAALSPGGPGGDPRPKHAARGMLITGGRAGVDDQLILAQKHEAIVPPHLVPPIAPYLKAHGVPGFGAGGVVGSYAGGVPGLGKWLASEDSATLRALESAVARATFAGITAARSSGGGFPGGGAVSGPGAAAAQAYARRTLGAYGWGQGQFPPLQALWNQESGWNVHALNAASGAYGIPQALPASKMAAAGADWRTNPATQIRWGLGYIKGRYGSPAAAEGHEMSAGWYDRGGFVPVGRSMAVNNTGAPERVLSGSQERGIEARLDRLIALMEHAPRATGHAMAEGLQGTARRAGARGMYSTRGAWA